MQRFSVLMSVYKNDLPQYLNQALHSILVNQSVIPDQVVLVVDGSIGNDLNNEISSWCQKYFQIDVVHLSENVGLSNAMNAGIKLCQHELIFRMDSDDLSEPKRFERQLDIFMKQPDVSMIGGSYRHFNLDMNKFVGSRSLPCNYEDIKKFAYRRTPINHVTIAFKRSVAEEVGCYPNTRLPFEDWWLALRFIKSKRIIINIEDDLVDVRGGESFMGRRSGFQYMIQEIEAMILMYKEGILPFYYALTNVLLRAPVRLLPNNLIQSIYQKLLR